MEITSWTVSTDRTSLDLVVSGAGSANVLRLWKTDTYKNYSLAIDLTTSLTGSSSESLSFAPSDLGESYFDGVYFIEIGDDDDLLMGITAELTRYRECVIERVLENGVCEDCLKSTSIPMINTHTLLRALEDAVSLSFIDEIIEIVGALNTYCSDTCKSCGSYNNEENSDYYTLNE